MIQLIGISLTVLLLMSLAIVAIQRLFRALNRPELSGTDPEHIKQSWEQLTAVSEQGVMGAKLAIIEADKLLDTVLRAMFMPGETLGERLKVACYKYPNLRRVWSAHKLRNQLVHESTFEISTRQAKIALEEYKAALKTLNVM